MPVRLSHLLRECAVGAVVRGPDRLVTVQDTSAWPCGPEHELRYVDQVRAALGIGKTLRSPPTARVEDGGVTGHPVPVTRFPRWTRCSRCGLLHHRPWKGRSTARSDARFRSSGAVWTCAGPTAGTARRGRPEQASQAPADGPAPAAPDRQACGGRLEQAPWVLAHEAGHLADVPWHAVAHAGHRHPARRQPDDGGVPDPHTGSRHPARRQPDDGGAPDPYAGSRHPARRQSESADADDEGGHGTPGVCRADRDQPYLKIVSAGRGHEVRCTRCGARNRLPDRFPFGHGQWCQPWFSEPPPEPPAEPAWVLAINDVRVHAPDTVSALVIPPESRIRRGTVVDRLYGSTDKQEEVRAARSGLPREAALRRIAREFGCTPAEVAEAQDEIDRGYPLCGQSVPGGGLLQGEYRALAEPIPDLREDEDFVTEHHGPDWRALVRGLEGAAAGVAGAVDRLVGVERLKEVLVFRGFRRLGGEFVTPPDLTGESDWLPALELYGEGVFFTLREDRLRRWEASEVLRARARMFADRLAGGPARLASPPQVSPRFLLLHTLAHLLVRELETAAGYPAASLKERIYSHAGGESDQPPMAGVLVYVAVPDTEGSMGGLLQQAEPRRFLRLLTAAVEAASWCSMDPVCGERDGHGPGLLNRAACHACALVPEPSCAYGNVLLDRTFVAGDAEGRCPPLFGGRTPDGSA